MACIYEEIEGSIVAYDHSCLVTVPEVIDAVYKLKPGKSDGYVGLSSDYYFTRLHWFVCAHFIDILEPFSAQLCPWGHGLEHCYPNSEG